MEGVESHDLGVEVTTKGLDILRREKRKLEGDAALKRSGIAQADEDWVNPTHGNKRFESQEDYFKEKNKLKSELKELRLEMNDVARQILEIVR